MFLPAVTSFQANSYGAGEITEYGSFIQNGTILTDPDGDPYVTQRPTFETSNDTAAPAARGRGVNHWEAADILYVVNDTVMYRDDYAFAVTLGASATAFTAGHRRVYFAILNDQMFILNPSGGTYGEGKYVDLGAPTVQYNMSATGSIGGDDFTGFPPENSIALAAGVAVLDKTMYVLDTDGVVWGSALNDGGNWSDSTNFITASKVEDKGVFIDVHYDNVVVFGSRSIQFLFNAENPVGSPLSTRQDIFFNVGCADPDCVWRSGDDIYFIGVETEGEIGAYRLRNFNLQKISPTSMTSYFTSSAESDDLLLTCSGMSAGNTVYFMNTIYRLSGGNIVPVLTLVFNDSEKVPIDLAWTNWEHSDATIDDFPLIAWTLATGGRGGEGVLTTGEILRLTDDYSPSDTEASTGYISDYISDYYTAESATGGPMLMIIQLDTIGDEEDGWLYCNSLRFVGDKTNSSQILTVKYADDGATNFNAGRTIDISNTRNKIANMGRFNKRTFKFEYSGAEQIRFKGVNLGLSKGL